jgi:hypothetical protein
MPGPSRPGIHFVFLSSSQLRTGDAIVLATLLYPARVG